MIEWCKQRAGIWERSGTEKAHQVLWPHEATTAGLTRRERDTRLELCVAQSGFTGHWASCASYRFRPPIYSDTENQFCDQNNLEATREGWLPVETQYLKCTYHWWKLAKIFFCIILIFFVCEIARGIRSLQITPNLVRVYLTWPCCGFSLFTCTSVFVSYIIYFKLNKASESVRRMFMLSITYVGSSRWKFPPGWNEVIR